MRELTGISLLAAAALLSLSVMGCSAPEPSVDAAPPGETDILVEDIEIAPDQDEEEN